jgi:hypothetical protein
MASLSSGIWAFSTPLGLRKVGGAALGLSPLRIPSSLRKRQKTQILRIPRNPKTLRGLFRNLWTPLLDLRLRLLLIFDLFHHVWSICVWAVLPVLGVKKMCLWPSMAKAGPCLKALPLIPRSPNSLPSSRNLSLQWTLLILRRPMLIASSGRFH